MQINFYGKCTGKAASKYDVFIAATTNSQDVNNNKSNVTLKFFVKRNDGYAESAYNLYTEKNTVSILVENEVKVSKNINIDTRNNVSYLLAQWTGDLFHNSDGTLSVDISAKFTMDNSNLTGGSVSGSLTLSTIPRKSALSISSSTVNPGGTVTATVTSHCDAFSHKITWVFGSKTKVSELNKGVLIDTFTVPESWMTEMTTASKGKITVSLTTYNGTNIVGTNQYNLSFVIPATDAYKPSFEIGLLRVNNGVPESFNEYVQNVSQVQVVPESLKFTYGATLSAITITVGSISIRKLPAVFNLPDSGDLTVTVAVRDSRGFLTVKTTSITVLEYSPPSVEITDLYRCTPDGVEDKLGTNLCVKYKLNYSHLNSKNTCVVTARYKTTNDSVYSSDVTLEAGNTVFGQNNISVSNSYGVVFSVTDSITSKKEEVLRFISSGNIPFNIKRGGNGAAFGKFSEKENELSLGWDLCVDGDVKIKGKIACDDVTFTPLENVEEIVGVVKYYSCFDGCFVRLRFKTDIDLEKDTNYSLAQIHDKIPQIFTPLNGFSNYSSGGNCSAGVLSQTGEVVFRSDTQIPVGTFIYISGFYLV